MTEIFKKRYVCVSNPFVFVDNNGIYWLGSGGGQSVDEASKLKGILSLYMTEVLTKYITKFHQKYFPKVIN